MLTHNVGLFNLDLCIRLWVLLSNAVCGATSDVSFFILTVKTNVCGVYC